MIWHTCSANTFPADGGLPELTMSWSHDARYDRDDVWRELPMEARLEWARDRLPKASLSTIADIASCQDVSTRDAFIEGYGHCVDEHDRGEGG